MDTALASLRCSPCWMAWRRKAIYDPGRKGMAGHDAGCFTQPLWADGLLAAARARVCELYANLSLRTDSNRFTRKPECAPRGKHRGTASYVPRLTAKLTQPLGV